MTSLPNARLLLAAVVLTGCGAGAPAAPTRSAVRALADMNPVSTPFELHAGTYWLQIYGHALSDDPAEPVCMPAGAPAHGTSVITRVRVTPTDDGWAAVSLADEGTIELRLARAGGVSPQGARVAGAIRGSAHDSTVGSYRPATDVSVTLRGLPDGDAVIVGVASAATPFLYGDIRGRIAFSDPSAAASSCRLVYWTLQPDGSALPAPPSTGGELAEN